MGNQQKRARQTKSCKYHLSNVRSSKTKRDSHQKQEQTTKLIQHIWVQS